MSLLLLLLLLLTTTGTAIATTTAIAGADVDSFDGLHGLPLLPLRLLLPTALFLDALLLLLLLLKLLPEAATTAAAATTAGANVALSVGLFVIPLLLLRRLMITT